MFKSVQVRIKNAFFIFFSVFGENNKMPDCSIHHSFSQLIIVASITMTVFLRTRMRADLVHASDYMGAISYSLIILVVDGLPELSLTVARLAIFYKQRDLYFYPAWAYAIPSAILKIPLSLLVATVWTCLTYYVIGYSPEAGR